MPCQSVFLALLSLVCLLPGSLCLDLGHAQPLSVVLHEPRHLQSLVDKTHGFAASVSQKKHRLVQSLLDKLAAIKRHPYKPNHGELVLISSFQAAPPLAAGVPAPVASGYGQSAIYPRIRVFDRRVDRTGFSEERKLGHIKDFVSGISSHKISSIKDNIHDAANNPKFFLEGLFHKKHHSTTPPSSTSQPDGPLVVIYPFNVTPEKPTTTSTTELPETTVPITTQSSTTESATTQPSTTEPATTQSSTTEPSTTQSSTTEPSTTQPSTVQP